MEVGQFSADFSFNDLQISFAVHHALDRYKRSRSVNRKANPEHLFVWVLHRLHKMFFTQPLVGRTANEFWIKSLNKKLTFIGLQSSSDQSLCFFSQLNRFFFIAAVNSCFIFVFLAYLPFSNNRRQTVDEDTCPSLSSKSLFNSSLVFRGFILLLRKMVKSSLW